MDFSQALKELKAGKKITRSSWLSKRWVALGGSPVVLEADKFWNKHSRAFAKTQLNQQAVVSPYFIEKTIDNEIQMGWAPNQNDCLAQDWAIVLTADGRYVES